MALTRPKIQDLDTTIEYFKDPITTINSGSTQANVDIGFMFNRASGLVANVSLYWSEAHQAFQFAYTNTNGEQYPYGNIVALSSANVSAGNVFVNALFYANGQPFVSSNYSNANVATFLTTGANITSNTITISNGIFWSNGNAYSSGSGTGTGHGVTYTAANVPPTTGNTPGDQWYDTITNVLYEYLTDGTTSSWVDVQSPAMSTNATYGNANVVSYLSSNTVLVANIQTNNIMWPNGTPMMFSTVQNQSAGATPPLTPSFGTQWYNTGDNTLYEYVTDGTNSVWVDVQSPTLSGNIPTTTYLSTYLPVYTGNITATDVIATFVGNVIGNQTDGNIWTTGNIIPSANITYNIGTPTQRFQSLYLGGNTIDLNGSLIKSEPTTGAFALVAAPTVAHPNPVAVIVTPGGGIVNYTTTGGVITTAQIATAATNAGLASTLNNLNVTSQASLASIVLTNGITWSGNGQPFVTSSFANANVASYLASGTDPTITSLLAATTTENSAITAANTAIITANTAMLAYVNATISTNFTTLTNYVNTQDGVINTSVSALQANAVSQETEISALQTGATAINVAIANTNTAITTANTAMLGYVNSQISSLTSNAASQEGEITSLRGNITAANAVIATHTTWLGNLQANVYSNSSVATYLPSYSGSLGGTITTGAQTNITSVGQLTGLTSTGIVNVTNATTSTASTNGALTVTGGVGIGGNLFVAGNITAGGNINFTGNVTSTNFTTSYGVFNGNTAGFGALYAGILGNAAQPNTTIQSVANSNSDSQINNWNTNNGANASTDFVATANNGSNADTFIDMGINGSGYSASSPFGASYANDGYMYVQGNTSTGGGNLMLATMTNNNIFFATGGQNANNIVAQVTYGNVFQVVSTNVSSSSTTGALQVAGGAGVAGSLFVGMNATFGSGQAGMAIRQLVSGTGAAIYNTNITPSASNYTLLTDGYSTTLNSAGGTYLAYQNSIVASLTTYMNVVNGAPSYNNSSGALVVSNSGGLGVSGNLNVGSASNNVHTLIGNVSITGNLSITGNAAFTYALPVTSGGTGATTVTQAQTNLNVDPAGTAIAMAIALG
jgi:hypothetical protein